jgi:spore maturation protein CgeB
MKWMTGASNKPFEYLAGGMPLLVSELPTWREMFVQPGYGRACDPTDAESIRTAVRWYLDHPDDRRAMGEVGRQQLLTEWNYEKEFAPVMNEMTERVSA